MRDDVVLLIFMEIAVVVSLMGNEINHLTEIADLYDEFYLTNDSGKIPPKESKKIKNTLIFLGQKNPKILFVISDLQELTGQNDQMIRNLIEKAIGISMEQAAIVFTIPNHEYTIDEIIGEIGARAVVVWGGDKSLPKYIVHESSEVRRVTVDSVSLFHESVDLKRKLWECIQQLLQMA